ncbi:MAG: hypothetical protein AAGD43_27205 [Pseudomonadota bacterium]
MTSKSPEVLSRAGLLCRSITALVVAAFWRRHNIKDIEAALAARSKLEQALAFGAIVISIFGLSLFAAQFGWLGLLAFWIALIVILR